MSSYIAVVHKDSSSEYGVSFPDFPGCITAGKSIDEVKDLAIVALSGHIKTMNEFGEKIPNPSKLDDIVADSDYSDAVAFLVVPIPDVKIKTVRVNITLPEDIVSSHRVPHLPRRSLRFAPLTCQALEVQEVRLRALRLAPGVSQARLPAAPCKKIQKNLHQLFEKLQDILHKIDAAARKRGMSRSSFLSHAAQNVM